MDGLELYVGNISSIDIKVDNALDQKRSATTCFMFFAKSEKEAIKVAQELNLHSYGVVKSIKLKGRDY